MKLLKDNYKSALNEIKDLQSEHETNRQELLDTIRFNEKELKYCQAINKMVLSEEEMEKIKVASE